LSTNAPSPLELAPPPDFRYVGLEVARPESLRAWLGLLGAGALTGTLFRGALGAVVGIGIAGASGALARLAGVGPFDSSSRGGAGGTGMAIVPWGVVVEQDDRSRILRWPGVIRVQVEAVHGRDGGTPHTRYSVVTIDTARERFVGRAAGTLPLERLLVHLDDYAHEASHRIALDLDGAQCGEGPSEPDAELVLSAARAYLATSSGAQRLELPLGGYRRTSSWGGRDGGSPGASLQLSRVLRDTAAREVDPRPFAAVVAALLDARDVAEDLVPLVQSPLPLLAAISKVAATKLRVAKAKVGALDEVEPFLLRRDVETLSAWQAQGQGKDG